MHRGLGLQGTPPRPPPSRKKGPAQSNPLEKFISESRLETSGALMRVSPRTQPPASDPGRLQVLGHSDQEDFLLSNQSLHPIFPGLGALLAEGEHLGVSTTPPPTPSMKTLKKQWLEVLSTYQYVLCFCFLGLFFSLVGFLLLFTSLWYLPVLYLVWLFLDWDTPQQGGRRYQWLKNWTAWKHLSDYFSIKLVKTAELPPDRNYVLASHPHGIIAVGTVCNFATEGTGLSQLFPGLRFSLAVLHCLLYLPGHREYFLSCGACSVNRQSLDYVLSQSQLGRAVVIVVGGANEALYAVPGEHCLTLRNRKGFVRLALRHGASLVPVYSFGENDIFRTKAFAPDSWQHRLQVTMKKLLSFSPCIFWGRGLFSAKSWGLLPFARPITTVVGRAIPVPQCPQPTEEQVDHYHSLYMKALEQLFEEHKESCGIPASTHLTFI